MNNLPPSHKFMILFLGIVLLLLMASVSGRVLRYLVKDGKGDEKRVGTVENWITRTRSWWGMIGVLAFAFVLGKAATLILFALISFFALREFITLTPTNPGDRRSISLAFFALIPVQYWLIGEGWYGMFAIFIPVYGFLLLPVFSVLTGDPENFLERSAKIQWGVMITIYCISYVPAVLLLNIPGYQGQNALLLFYLLLIVQMSDVLQYVFGKLFGKTKIAPAVSPSKTVEGFVGGSLSATLVGASMWWITPFTPWQSAGMAFIIVLMGFLGGLTLSAVKRSLGAKDWGVMIKGHGGMMDRMDSVVFAAPIFFHLTRYFFS